MNNNKIIQGVGKCSPEWTFLFAVGSGEMTAWCSAFSDKLEIEKYPCLIL
jgi:hypothetical protein